MDALRSAWDKAKSRLRGSSGESALEPAGAAAFEASAPELAGARGSAAAPDAWGDSALWVLYNPGSGGVSKGLPGVLDQIAGRIRQLTVLSMTHPALQAELAELTADPTARVLVIGGDGTVAWALGMLQAHEDLASPASDSPTDTEVPICRLGPAVAVCPGGTGNDLSRVLGWGSQVKDWGLEAMTDRLRRVALADTVLVDQWRLSQYPFGVGEPELVFTNYLSIGVDAAIALDFHQGRRDRHGSQVIENKIKYLAASVSTALDKAGTHDLSGELCVWCDEVQVELGGLVAVVMLNIASYGAGADLWGRAVPQAQFTHQSASDGVLELFGFESLTQLGLAQLGQSTGRQLAQGTNFRLESRASLAWQADGEPWVQRECAAEVTMLPPARMLSGHAPTGKPAVREIPGRFGQPEEGAGCKQQ